MFNQFVKSEDGKPSTHNFAARLATRSATESLLRAAGAWCGTDAKGTHTLIK
jgi:hypothetical protein